MIILEINQAAATLLPFEYGVRWKWVKKDNHEISLPERTHIY